MNLTDLMSSVLTSKLIELAVLRKGSSSGGSKQGELGRTDWFESVNTLNPESSKRQIKSDKRKSNENRDLHCYILT